MGSLTYTGCFAALHIANIGYAALDAKKFNVCPPKAAIAYAVGTSVSAHAFFSAFSALENLTSSSSLPARVISFPAGAVLAGFMGSLSGRYISRYITRILYNEDITPEKARVLHAGGTSQCLTLLPIIIGVSLATRTMGMDLPFELQFAATTALSIACVSIPKLFGKNFEHSSDSTPEIKDQTPSIHSSELEANDQSTFERLTPPPVDVVDCPG